MSIANTVNNILMDQLQVRIEDIEPKATLADDLGADSLDLVEIVMALEEEFNIEIPDEEVFKGPCTVGRIYEYIGKQVGE